MDAFLEAKGWLALLAPLVSALLVLALIAPARRFGMVDHPGGRKNHDHPTPLVGGVAIFLAFLMVNALGGAIPGGSQSLLAAMAESMQPEHTSMWLTPRANPPDQQRLNR